MALDQDGARTPKKEAELQRIEVLRKSLCKRIGDQVTLDAIPDEDVVGQRSRACDAILKGGEIRFAVELTIIDSYVGQQFDDDKFRRVMGAMETRVDKVADWVEVAIDVGAVPIGYDWSELSCRLEEQLLTGLCSLPFDTTVPVQIASVPFVVWVRREHGRGNGRIVVMRRVPAQLEEQRCAVIKRAIAGKREMLRQYKVEDYQTVLLLENQDVALTDRHLICDAFKKVFPGKLWADAIDDVYLIETDTRPWAISPLKLGSHVFDEPHPEWPDAPGYPFEYT